MPEGAGVPTRRLSPTFRDDNRINGRRQTAMIATQTTQAAPTCPSRDRPIDLVHLARQTGGSQSVEREVLGIMARQITDVLARTQPNRPGDDLRPAAHAMSGAAGNLGAFPLARAAKLLEAAPSDREALAGFRREMERTLAFIRTLVPRSDRVDALRHAH